jgi:hypothetical protein
MTTTTSGGGNRVGKPTIALAFATIGRPDLAQRLIRSVRRVYPELRIYVADQSQRVEEMLGFYDQHDIRLVRMPFDAGVCASRNRLVEEMEEDYFLLCDDDFVFWPETRFSDAVSVLEAYSDIGVVGGRLLNTSVPSHVYEQHWEMYFQYDPRNRLLITIPMYHLIPVTRRAGDIEVFLCDSVLNFAVFRRSMFSDSIRWDERYKSNGEHEDFYLNLKLNSAHKVAYLPSMTAEHCNPFGHQRYASLLRSRSEGWRLFLDKWRIDQHLEAYSGVRGLQDPSIALQSWQAQSLYTLSPLREQPRPAPNPSTWAQEEITGLGLVFRYDALLKPDVDMVLWYRCESPTDTTSAGALAVHFRWFGARGQTLLWEGDKTSLDLGPGDYWRPALVQPPLWPAHNEWMRFEMLAEGGSVRVVLCAGFCFPAQPDSEVPHLERPMLDVLAFSPRWLLAADMPTALPSDHSHASVSGTYGVESRPYLLIDLPDDQAARSFVLADWALYGGVLGVRIPSSRLDVPRAVAIPVQSIGIDRRRPPSSRIFGASSGSSFSTAKFSPAERTSAPITAVLTSCGRQDLLECTLETFFSFNTMPLERMIVIEDGPAGANAALMRKFRHLPIEWWGTEWWVGQINAIDSAYASIDTDYIFHLEDDWEFYASGFIEKSLRVLEADPHCLQVWLRALDDTNGHPVAPETELVGGIPCRRMEKGYLGTWHGFSFNPGLRRHADYLRIGSFGHHAGHDKRHPGISEGAISRIYDELGFHAYILADGDGQGYVRHIGWGRMVSAGLRHTKPPVKPEVAPTTPVPKKG